jgi:hypothetical protein
MDGPAGLGRRSDTSKVLWVLMNCCIGVDLVIFVIRALLSAKHNLSFTSFVQSKEESERLEV